ncbi:MAG: hypothetical protein AMJ75_00080 [Phycisphaerae bacterium SM1_79]|nr:MAG: hypothetical protein AMJ75_00080 [Phycisphaerae bacterium SM1_79]
MIRKSSKNSESGIAFIAVLLIIAVLAVIILEFNYESRMKLHLADNFHLASQALNCAEAGIAISMAALRQNSDILADEELSPFFSGMLQIPIEEDYCIISIVDESGKININALRTSGGQLVRHRVDQMLRLVDLLNYQYGEDSPFSYSLIPAMIDWVDPDDDVTYLSFVKRENVGAENDHYQNLEDPYPCKNAPFDVLSELLLVKGMTMEMFQGRAGNESTGIKPANGIQQFLTVYGDGKININAASTTVIQSLSDRIDYTLAQNIVEHRRFSRYESIKQLQEVPGMTSEIYGDLRGSVTVRPQGRYYTVTVTGVVGQFVRKVQVVLRRDGHTAQVAAVLRREL